MTHDEHPDTATCTTCVHGRACPAQRAAECRADGYSHHEARTAQRQEPRQPPLEALRRVLVTARRHLCTQRYDGALKAVAQAAGYAELVGAELSDEHDALAESRRTLSMAASIQSELAADRDLQRRRAEVAEEALASSVAERIALELRLARVNERVAAEQGGHTAEHAACACEVWRRGGGIGEVGR
jgi:hypothetical protein